jgi:hypothetical protein
VHEPLPQEKLSSRVEMNEARVERAGETANGTLGQLAGQVRRIFDGLSENQRGGIDAKEKGEASTTRLIPSAGRAPFFEEKGAAPVKPRKRRLLLLRRRLWLRDGG